MQSELNFDKPYVPEWQKGESQSQKAHADVMPRKGSQKYKLVAFIAQHPYTCDEYEFQTGVSHQTASARKSEAHKEGLIRAEGQKPTRSGSDADILHVTEKGREWLESFWRLK